MTVTPDGRIIMSLHQFYEPEFRVVELVDGEIVPFPTAEWARPRQADGTGLGAVLGLRSDQSGVVWLLDNGNGGETSQRLVGWDTRADGPAKVVEIPPEASVEGSFHNDLALDAERPLAYLADIAGGIGVVNLETGEGWRALDGHESTAAEDVDSWSAARSSQSGRRAAADGAEPEHHLARQRVGHYGAMNGTALWRVPADALADRVADVAAAVGEAVVGR